MNALLAQQIQPLISGRALIQSVILLIVLGLVFGLLWWLIDYCAIPEPFNKAARVVLAIAAVLIVIGVLLSLAGYPLVGW